MISRVLATVLLVTLCGCAEFGAEPGAADRARYAQAPNYSVDEQKFLNETPGTGPGSRSRVKVMWNVLKERMRADNLSPPVPLPTVRPDFTRFADSDDSLKVIWFGHSSFLINIDGVVVLVDPVFENAAPVRFAVGRYQPPPASLAELPEIDYVLISHDHYDHLEMRTVTHFVDHDVTFVVPLGVGSHLKRWGVSAKRIVEKNWWESAQFDDVEFIAAPSQHFSGRTGLGANYSLWSSWIVRTGRHRVYFSGDSGYAGHFREIGERYGPFDVAFMETGQYNQSWSDSHLFPQDALEALFELKARRYFPVHWGVFSLATHSWDHPIKEITRLARSRGAEVIAPKMGAIWEIGDRSPERQWWRDVDARGTDDS